MARKSNPRVSVVIPNWNGKDTLGDCLDSLLAQTFKSRIIVVENGSVDGSLEFLHEHYPTVTVLANSKNLGFAGGVNTGIRQALADDDEFVALFNNDAVADKDWLKELVADLVVNDDAGIATCKLLDAGKKHFDSTGEMYTSWGLPYPRGRGEPVSDKYDDQVEVFAASGGATLYRMAMLREIGLFDEDFFAYYEDVDLSFRAQLAGWKVRYVPEAVAYHQIGATSSKIAGFTTYQTVKNLPLVLWKNAPLTVYIRILPRFTLAYFSIIFSAFFRGKSVPAMKGFFMMLFLLPRKSMEQARIQSHKRVSPAYIWVIMTHDLPPNAHKLRRLVHPFRRPAK